MKTNSKRAVKGHLAASRKQPIIRDKKSALVMAHGLAAQLLARTDGRGKGTVFTSREFLDLAGHDTVRQVLGRLVEHGTAAAATTMCGGTPNHPLRA